MRCEHVDIAVCMSVCVCNIMYTYVFVCMRLLAKLRLLPLLLQLLLLLLFLQCWQCALLRRRSSQRGATTEFNVKKAAAADAAQHLISLLLMAIFMPNAQVLVKFCRFFSITHGFGELSKRTNNTLLLVSKIN